MLSIQLMYNRCFSEFGKSCYLMIYSVRKLDLILLFKANVTASFK